MRRKIDYPTSPTEEPMTSNEYGAFPADMRDAKTWAEIERFKEAMPHTAWRILCAEINRHLRKQKPWHGGLKFFTKTNVKWHWNLLSRHRTHQLCWSWILSLSLTGYGHRWLRLHSYCHITSVDILKIRITFTRQLSDWMLWMPHGTEINLHRVGQII